MLRHYDSALRVGIDHVTVLEPINVQRGDGSARVVADEMNGGAALYKLRSRYPYRCGQQFKKLINETQ